MRKCPGPLLLWRTWTTLRLEVTMSLPQAELLRQQARVQRRLGNIKRANQLLKENPEMSRFQALAQAVGEARDKQNNIYSESGKNV